MVTSVQSSSPQPTPPTPSRARFVGVVLASSLALGGAARAQGAWTIGRPEPLPEFQSPVAPPPKPVAARPVAPKTAPKSAAAASAASAPSLTDPGQSVALNEVLVIGRPPGPALWRVRKGDSEVVIVGGLSPLPHLLQWNAVRVQAALTGAKVLLAPPSTQVGVFEGAKLMLRSGAIRLPGAQPLQSKLPPPLRARFEAAVKLTGQPPSRYAKWRPVAAGLLLIGDFRRAAGLSTAKPGSTVARMAKAHGVPVRTQARLSFAPVFDSLAGLPDAQQLACLDAAVDEVAQERDGARPAAQAWADGRLDQVRAHWSTAILDRCLLPNARAQALLEAGTAAATREMEAALRSPGRTVALVDLHLLLRTNGLLDRLKADGAEITVPGG